jgi:hypothetical protein
MKRIARGVVLAAVVTSGLIFALPACDNSTTPTPVATPTPTPIPVRGVIAQFSFDQFYPDIYVGIPLPLSQGGILDVTFDWTYPDTTMYAYIARGTCTYDELAGKTCPYIVTSETQTPKPRVLVTQPLAAGTYSLILYNVPRNPSKGILAEHVEAVSCQLGLTVGVPIPTATSIAPMTVRPVFLRPNQ